MRIGYKTFFQGAAWSLTTLMTMGFVIRGDYWFVLISGALAIISLCCGTSNAEKLP